MNFCKSSQIQVTPCRSSLDDRFRFGFQTPSEIDAKSACALTLLRPVIFLISWFSITTPFKNYTIYCTIIGGKPMCDVIVLNFIINLVTS